MLNSRNLRERERCGDGVNCSSSLGVAEQSRREGCAVASSKEQKRHVPEDRGFTTIVSKSIYRQCFQLPAFLSVQLTSLSFVLFGASFNGDLISLLRPSYIIKFVIRFRDFLVYYTGFHYYRFAQLAIAKFFRINQEIGYHINRERRKPASIETLKDYHLFFPSSLCSFCFYSAKARFSFVLKA